MARRQVDVEFHAVDSEREDNVEVSVDLIDDGLYLGNQACARDIKELERLQITHILTIDLVPLPHSILDRAQVHFKFIKLADVPGEDLIAHLPETNAYIKQAIEGGGTVLVHCYFGVSRSAAVVIAYIMEKKRLTYEEAFAFVKSKRRFIGPNVGFVSQLTLFGRMQYKLDRDDPRFKQYRLRMAGKKLKQVKILPQLFADLIKPDPGLVRERPDPIVYRCKKCRRIVAGQNNIIPHIPKQVKIDLAKRGMRPPPSKLAGLQCAENGQVLIEKLKSLACQIIDGESGGEASDEGPSQLDGYTEQSCVDHSIARDGPDVCRLMWFVEPMAWMARVGREAQGKLHCPKCQNKIGSFSWVCGSKCQNKIGSFSWVCGCRCPCGQKVAPAFYLVPSKVEWSNIVQNVQVTV